MDIRRNRLRQHGHNQIFNYLAVARKDSTRDRSLYRPGQHLVGPAYPGYVATGHRTHPMSEGNDVSEYNQTKAFECSPDLAEPSKASMSM